MTPRNDPTIWRVDDALWARLAPLLTSDKPRKKPGRPRRDDRVLFDGLIWVLRTGAQWAALPTEFGPKSTCHARFQEWVQAGAFQRAWALLLAEYDDLAGLEWRWQAADGCLVKAPLGKKGLQARCKRQAATRLTEARRAAGPRPLWRKPPRYEETGRSARRARDRGARPYGRPAALVPGSRLRL